MSRKARCYPPSIYTALTSQKKDPSFSEVGMVDIQAWDVTEHEVHMGWYGQQKAGQVHQTMADSWNNAVVVETTCRVLCQVHFVESKVVFGELVGIHHRTLLTKFQISTLCTHAIYVYLDYSALVHFTYHEEFGD